MHWHWERDSVFYDSIVEYCEKNQQEGYVVYNNTDDVIVRMDTVIREQFFSSKIQKRSFVPHLMGKCCFVPYKIQLKFVPTKISRYPKNIE